MGRDQDARRRQKIIEIGLGPRASSLRLPYFFRSWASRMKISREAPDVSDRSIATVWECPSDFRFRLDCVAKLESCSGLNFRRNLKRKEIDDSHTFSRATEVAHEFGARRRGPSDHCTNNAPAAPEFLTPPAKRLLQHNRPESRHPYETSACLRMGAVPLRRQGAKVERFRPPNVPFESAAMATSLTPDDLSIHRHTVALANRELCRGNQDLQGMSVSFGRSDGRGYGRFTPDRPSTPSAFLTALAKTTKASGAPPVRPPCVTLAAISILAVQYSTVPPTFMLVPVNAFERSTEDERAAICVDDLGPFN